MTGTMTKEQYLEACKPRFGKTNPERMREPVWEWMVREGHNPFIARTSLGLEREFVRGDPDWCFDRMGRPRVDMPDGRRIFIAGEHEDWYDPDFCIYNDVIVRRGDDVEIYGYPRKVFPPTDFHTATLVGDQVVLIGSLGYPKERRYGTTQVFVLDTNTYSIRRVKATGAAPGWINHHRARLLDDGKTIELTDGLVEIKRKGKDEVQSWRNVDRFELDTAAWAWRKTTDSSAWRQFRIAYESDVLAGVANVCDVDPIRSLGWYSGAVLGKLGYPYTPAPDPDLDDDVDEADDEGSDRVHVIHVDGVDVACRDGYDEIEVIVKGILPEDRVQQLLEGIKSLLPLTDYAFKSIEEVKR